MSAPLSSISAIAGISASSTRPSARSSVRTPSRIRKIRIDPSSSRRSPVTTEVRPGDVSRRWMSFRASVGSQSMICRRMPAIAGAIGGSGGVSADQLTI